MGLRSSKQRKVILHYHLFKNAGTSIDRGLQEVLGDRWISFDRKERSVKISAAEMEEFILDHPEGVAFSSHQVVPPLPARHLDVFPIVLLRHPIDRAYSAYRFEVDNEYVPLPNGSFEEYLAYRFEHQRRSAVEDFQTFHLANTDYERRAPAKRLSDEQVLENARAFLREIRCFGIVDQFDRSLEVLNANLAREFPDLSLPSYRVNVLQPERSLSERVDRIRSELSREAYRELTRRNQLDLRLYEYATALFSTL